MTEEKYQRQVQEGVSLYVEFDSTRENFAKKLTNFVQKTPYVIWYYQLKQTTYNLVRVGALSRLAGKILIARSTCT